MQNNIDLNSEDYIFKENFLDDLVSSSSEEEIEESEEKNLLNDFIETLNKTSTEDEKEKIQEKLKVDMINKVIEIKLEENEKVEVEIAVDSEFKEDRNISCQARVKIYYKGEIISFGLFIIDNKYKIIYSQEILKGFEEKNNVKVYFCDLNQDSSQSILLEVFLVELKRKYNVIFNISKIIFNVTLYFYYSIKDLIISLGTVEMKRIISNSKLISQNRSVTGEFSITDVSQNIEIIFNIVLKDLFGFQNSSLEELALSWIVNKATKITIEVVSKI